MPLLHDLVPDAQTVLAMGPDEIGAVLLEYLQAMPMGDQSQAMHPNNISGHERFEGYPQERRESLRQIIMEGWAWLITEGLIAPRPGDPDWHFITRRGQKFKTAGDLRGYRESTRFPRALPHVAIADRVWGDFGRADYDTAVFKAFHDVEVAVRDAAGLLAGDIGVALMNRAFGEGGPLEDARAEAGERKSMRELLSGAIGTFKNPQSHRHVALTEPEEAFEMLMLASHLMRIVDGRLSRQHQVAP